MANVKDKRGALREKARKLTTGPGCYLMKDSRGKIVYIGKAKNLKNRVASYFGNSKHSPKTEILVSHIESFDFMLTSTEAEALVLENNLIKKHLPRYNVMLKDDKSYPYAVVDYNHSFPSIVYTRKLIPGKKKKVFGPFVTGTNIGGILRILINSFSIRDCSDREFKGRKTPCLRYQMGQCSAPCVGKITESDYALDLALALNLLEGKGRRTIAHLEKKMEQHSANEEYEKAMMIRDNLQKLDDFLLHAQQKCAELTGREKSLDVVGVYEGDNEIDIAIYMVRGGILLGHRHLYFEKDESDFTSELFGYYRNHDQEKPRKMVLDLDDENLKLLTEAFVLESINFEIVPPGNKFAELSILTNKYAKEQQIFRKRSSEESSAAHLKLKELLGLPVKPRRIEGVDVAIFQGKSPTASVVSFLDGKPQKSDYRHYHLKELPEGNNDFEMMRELFVRRLKKGNLPDLFLVDGGHGQLKTVQTAMEEVGLVLPLVGIAKSRTTSDFRSKDIEQSSERLVIPGRSNPYSLSKFPPLLKLLVALRDEAHRFCRRLHHNSEEKKLLTSWLDEVPGIGTKWKKEILSRLDRSFEELATLSEEEISSLLKLPKGKAEILLRHLKELI